MQFSDDLAKGTATSKLLPFRAPAPALQGLEATPDPEQVPHDIGALRRPVPVESRQAPRMDEADGLAHDARNLMASLSLVAGLLEEPGVLQPGHEHYAGDLKSLAGSLSGIVERLAAPRTAAGAATGPAVPAKPGRPGEPVFAREPLRPRLPKASATAFGMEAGSREQDLPRDAGSLVKSCERLLAAIAGPGVSLQISYERGLGTPALGGEELTRVLINLVKNASEAMPGGGRVAITVRKALGSTPAALISVQDTGGGIPAHALGQIFQAGFSSKKAARRWPAMSHHGLGLTIVRDLVEGAGGSVRVSSALRKGTTFELKVPCRRPS